MIRKILIANRGEIALRIIRSCREMGIKCVTVHSTADFESPHVKYADKSICIGPPPPSKSYLNIDNIITAALISECDAIHPGYGFLSENSSFVEKCIENNLIFIGPPAESIELAGNKSNALDIMRKNRIPVIPGSIGSIKDIKSAFKTAKILGYPVIIKASFGGGGKGMRICRNQNDLSNFFPVAVSESISSFGKSEIYMEKYLNKPRHIEFQIIADNFGEIRCIGERECSIQRRHQKLIEEAPSSNLPQRTLKIMNEYAIKAAHAINYKNLGTVEFLVDEKGNFYFIEINTRIQVEHPVTEMVTGMDLVKEQIKIASGEKIAGHRENFNVTGHAIEFRINAEDPDNGFAPNPGKITNCHIPGGPGVRVDTFIGCNTEVSPFYDSMLAKLIIWDKTREDAISRSARALNEFEIHGIKTTIPFHLKILENENFKKGNIHTHFIDEEL